MLLFFSPESNASLLKYFTAGRSGTCRKSKTKTKQDNNHILKDDFLGLSGSWKDCLQQQNEIWKSAVPSNPLGLLLHLLNNPVNSILLKKTQSHPTFPPRFHSQELKNRLHWCEFPILFTKCYGLMRVLSTGTSLGTVYRVIPELESFFSFLTTSLPEMYNLYWASCHWCELSDLLFSKTLWHILQNVIIQMYHVNPGYILSQR